MGRSLLLDGVRAGVRDLKEKKRVGEGRMDGWDGLGWDGRGGRGTQDGGTCG